jgi:hypothetical protein
MSTLSLALFSLDMHSYMFQFLSRIIIFMLKMIIHFERKEKKNKYKDLNIFSKQQTEIVKKIHYV